MNKYDVGIIGGGVAGCMASLRVAQNYKSEKVVMFELGSLFGKRRRFLEGALGTLPTGDGKLYINDYQQLLDTIDGRTVKSAHNYVLKQFEQAGPMKVTKDKLPNASVLKKIESSGFEIETNDFVQWTPDPIHRLSKIIAEQIESNKNITLSFNNEVHKITKLKSGFTLTTDEGDVFCKKIIIAVGRSGWRWVNKLYHDMGLIINDNIASYGVTIELSSSQLKDWNKSHCFLQRKDMEIGPFNYNGTVIPEDHADLVLAGFRSNEERWKSEKVSFPIIGFKEVEEGQGIIQTDRLGKLAFLLYNDRVSKEKIKSLLTNEWPLAEIPEYAWLKDAIKELSSIIPAITTKASYHAPTILPMAANIRLGSNLETEVEDMFVAGESAGFRGIMAAAISGTIAIDSVCK